MNFKEKAIEILSKTVKDDVPAFTSSLTDNQIEKFSPLIEQALREAYEQGKKEANNDNE